MTLDNKSKRSVVMDTVLNVVGSCCSGLGAIGFLVIALTEYNIFAFIFFMFMLIVFISNFWFLRKRIKEWSVLLEND